MTVRGYYGFVLHLRQRAAAGKAMSGLSHQNTDCATLDLMPWGAESLSTIHNERIKLTANCLNIISAGCIITGVVAPAVAVIYGAYGQTGPALWLMVMSSAIWLLTGLGLHWLGRRLLGRLR